jgi:energy-coupling factor transport system permease protein
MKMALAYAPRPGPLGSARPWIAALYLAPLAVTAFAFANPILLIAAGLGALAAGVASGAGGSLRQPLRWSIALGVMVIVVNGITSQRGDTILLRGWHLPVLGQIDISAEALAEGGVLALRIVVAILVFAVWSACVDPDRILRAIRPIAARSALTATLVARMVPLAAADAARLGEAAGLRGPGAAPIGRATLARRMVAGSLDRSVDIAATLELRGYGLGTRARMPRHRREPGEVLLIVSGVVSLGLLIAASIAGVAAFDAYPRVSIDADPVTLGLAAAVGLLPLLPFVPAALPRLRHPLRPAPVRVVEAA